jgi:RecB family exonuclease
MQPRTVSASALATWEECPAKYKAVYIDRLPEIGKKPAADTGTTVHYAFEHFVDEVYLQKVTEWSNKARLDELLKEGYRETFHSASYDSAEFKDAQKMADDWYARTDLTRGTVLSVEKKVQYPLPATSGEIPLTYILDRLDVVDNGDGTVDFHVVDYKSQRANESFEELENKLQAQIYALAVYLQYGQQYIISTVWVHLDLLRHSVVGTDFSWEESLELWYWLIEQVDIIRAMPDDQAPEVLGPGCSYCPRKVSCLSLKRHLDSGGVMGSTDLEAILKLRIEADGQLKGLRNLVGELDALAGELMNQQQVTRIPVGDMIAEWGTGRGTRQVDSARAAKILGPEIMENVATVGVTKLDEIIDSGILDEEQIKQLKSITTMKYGESGVRYKKAPKPRVAKGREPK